MGGLHVHIPGLLLEINTNCAFIFWIKKSKFKIKIINSVCFIK